RKDFGADECSASEPAGAAEPVPRWANGPEHYVGAAYREGVEAARAKIRAGIESPRLDMGPLERAIAPRGRLALRFEDLYKALTGRPKEDDPKHQPPDVEDQGLGPACAEIGLRQNGPTDVSDDQQDGPTDDWVFARQNEPKIGVVHDHCGTG